MAQLQLTIAQIVEAIEQLLVEDLLYQGGIFNEVKNYPLPICHHCKSALERYNDLG